VFISATVPSHVNRNVGDLINRYDGPRAISKVVSRERHPSVTIAGRPAYVETYLTTAPAQDA
jgi:hypothetical protein